MGASDGAYASTGFHENDPDKVFVVGHSEGALIATELAAADPSLAGVVLLAGPATSGEEMLRWQAKQVNDSLPRAVRVLLRVLRRDVVRTQTKRLAQIAATTTDTARIQRTTINAKWFREFMSHDPAPSLASIQVPTLAITGSKDMQVNPRDVEGICRLVPADCSAHVIEDLSHILRTEAGPPSLRTYNKQTKRPVDTGLLTTTSSWIAAQVTKPTMRTTRGRRIKGPFDTPTPPHELRS